MKSRLVLLLLLLKAVISMSQKLVPYYQTNLAGMPQLVKIEASDDHFFISGYFDHLNSEVVGGLIKVDRNGKMDPTFNPVYADAHIYDVRVLPDKKLLVSGNFRKMNGVAVNNLVRLLSNGTIDTTFWPEVSVGEVGIQSDGKLVVVGGFQGLKGYSNFGRLNTDGTIDETFEKTNLAFGSRNQIVIGPDNKIYASDGRKVYRFSSQGMLDPSFFVGEGVDADASGYIDVIKLTPTGKVVIGGFFQKYNGASYGGLVQLKSNGLVDTEFDIGAGAFGGVYDIVVRSNGNMVIGGQFTSFNNQSISLVELNPNGSLKQKIALVSTNSIESICETYDNKIAIVGWFESVNGTAHKYTVAFNTDYTIDQNFKPDISFLSTNGRFLDVDAGHDVVTGGSEIRGVYSNGTLIEKPIIKLDRLGNYKGSFAAQVTSPGAVLGCAVQTDNKVLISGYGFGSLIRLNTDGSRDNSFSTGSGIRQYNNPSFPNLIKQNGATLYLGGNIDNYDGHATKSLVAINLDGSFKTAFTDLPENTYIYDIDFQSDGKIVALGNFPFQNGTMKVVRLLTSGQLDNTFQPLNVIGNINKVRVDSQNRIYLGGEIFSVNGALTEDAVRILPNGNLDASFDLGTGFMADATGMTSVSAIEFLPDDRIAIGGAFAGIQNHSSPGFVIVSSSGQFVPTPDIKFGPTTNAFKMKYFDNALYLSGVFTNDDRSSIYGVAKITFLNMPAPAAPADLRVTLKSAGTFEVKWADKSDNELAFVLERSLSESGPFRLIKTIDAGKTLETDASIEANKTYYYRLMAVNDGGQSSYSAVASQIWIPVPAAPKDLTVNQEKLNELILHWTDVSSNEKGFVIERTADNKTEKLDTVDFDNTSFTDKNVNPDKLYRYRVFAYNLGGVSEYSNEVSITSLSIPLKPNQLSARQTKIGEVVVEWVDNSFNEQGFHLERSVDGGSSFPVIRNLDANAKQYVDITDPNHDSYLYRIKAYNKVGSSEYSDSYQIMVVLGLGETTAGQQAIYPNPTGDYIFIGHELSSNYLNWEFVNAQGKAVPFDIHQQHGILSIDVRKFDPGIYVLRAYNEEYKPLSIRIVISR